jgi:thioredoxin 1
MNGLTQMVFSIGAGYGIKQIYNSYASFDNSLVEEVVAEDLPKATLKGVTLLDIYAPWCPPCQRLAPILERIAEAVKGRGKIIKLDGDAFRGNKVIGDLEFQSYPTLILFKDGKEVRRITENERSEEKIKDIILSHYLPT